MADTNRDAPAPLAVYARVPSGLAAALLLLLLGGPFFGAGVNIALSRFGEGAGLMAFSMILNLPALLILRNWLRVRRAAEEVLIFADRVERRTRRGVDRLPMSALQRIEAQIRSFESGNRYHTYRLSFVGEATLTIETDTHKGVDAETGRLLERISGVRIQGFA